MSAKISKITIVTPHKYSAWPLIGSVKGKMICTYTVADKHDATDTAVYLKTSDTNGQTWSEPTEIFTDKKGVKGATGMGYNAEGDMLLWHRNGKLEDVPGAHQLYKIEGTKTVLVSSPDFSLRSGHIGNIFQIPDKGLFAFYNTYGETRSWGVLKSADDGFTWEQIPVEENIPRSECPVEIECACVEGDRILVLGRKDAEEGTIAMFQIQSCDRGETWTKEYTNITDSYGNSPSVIYDRKTGRINLYYFVRFGGELKRRVVYLNDVWDAPLNWSDSEVLTAEPYGGWDTGNVKTTAVGETHFCTYYAGTPTTTGVYGVIVDDK
ncbi:MAG: exo-alpha-sialidase [Oscillospiraceae bacterium]|nr:exo-alpha-sialidase [Oscillospiraceae bacterium]